MVSDREKTREAKRIEMCSREMADKEKEIKQKNGDSRVASTSRHHSRPVKKKRKKKEKRNPRLVFIAFGEMK